MPSEMRYLREPVSITDDNDDDAASPFNGPGSSFTKKLYDIIDTAESTEIVCWSKGNRYIDCSASVSCPTLLTYPLVPPLHLSPLHQPQMDAPLKSEIPND